MRFESGSMFAGYTVVSRLGRGGMATVYLVREVGLDRLVALKVLPEQLVDDQQFGGRFEQEARVIGSLDHPHIIPLYRYGITEDVPWMALRYVDGGDFAARLIARPLALAEGFAILRGVASALDYAHRKSVVHRDIKPQNILLTSEGNSYLADFGVAKLLQASNVSHTLIGGIVGSPAYMAPEQAQGHAIGPHTDIYSLAVICFQWLTGGLPFEADTPHAILLKHVLEPLPTHALGMLAPPVAVALQRGMAKKPEDRFATAGLLIAALEQAMYAPMTMSYDGLPALTPSGLRAVSGVDARIDSQTTLSRPVDARLDTPTTLSRAVVEPLRPPYPPPLPPPAPAPTPPTPAPPAPVLPAAPPLVALEPMPRATPRLEPIAAPIPAPVPTASFPPPPQLRQPAEPASASLKTGHTAEPISRLSAMMQSLNSPAAASVPSPKVEDAAAEGMWAQLRRPLAFGALGAALLIGAYASWRLLMADPAVPSADVAGSTSAPVAETGSEPESSTSASSPEASVEERAEARAALKRELERAEGLRTGATDGSDPAATTTAPTPDPALAAQRLATERLEADQRAARLLEEKRVAAQRKAEILAAQKPVAQPAAKPTAAAAPPATAVRAPPPTSPATQAQPAPPPVVTAPPVTAPPVTAPPVTAPVVAAPRPASGATPQAVGGFVDKGGGVLTDTRNGTEWSQSDNGSSIDWKDAQRHCRKRGSGWRLPNGSELVGIIGRGGSTSCGNKSCRVSPLFNLSGSSFWTSEKRGRTLSMVVYLNTGSAEALPVDRGSPRSLCVRKP